MARLSAGLTFQQLHFGLKLCKNCRFHHSLHINVLLKINAFKCVQRKSYSSSTSFLPNYIGLGLTLFSRRFSKHSEKPGPWFEKGLPSLSDNGTEYSAEEKRDLQRKKKEAKRLERLERQRIKAEHHSKRKEKEKSEEPKYSSPTLPGEKKDTQCPLPAGYSPQYVEAAWYEWWDKMGFFKPYPDDIQAENSDPFVMCLPPPNVTGTLHLGHALGNSIEDAITRWNRMRGRPVLWNPGCDHAGIATQVVVEQKLWREHGKTRHQLGRKEFVKEIWKWKEEKGNRIYEQMKRLGSSLDWSRECFTLDPKLSRAVTEAFVRLYEDGLVYRDNRLVNWSCTLKSAISDIEVEDLSLEGRTLLEVPGYEKKVPFGTLTSFAYQVHGAEDRVIVATTRPETMLGDTAIAVHPEDSRYTHLHGRHVTHPFNDRLLPIVCDEFVERSFGTGAVKITPAHDHNDYDLGKRHNLDFISVIDDAGCMINVPDLFQNMKRFDARGAVVKALKDLGLYHGDQDHPMSLPVCSRSKDVIEPLLKDQWYINCHEMAQKAIEAVQTGDLELVPDQYEKKWFDWLENIKDWCVSRQLWWGHRIPTYEVSLKNNQDTKSEWVCARSDAEALVKACTLFSAPEEDICVRQDDDVLDTWFSSALFPFSIFGWPDQTADLNQFYPTELLETASDIMFFWVARMVMFGEKLTGQLPFKQVLFHSILRDAHGRKMSKSLGNIIDPMDVIRGTTLEELHTKVEQSNFNKSELDKARKGLKKDFPLGIPECGADALRFTLCSYNYKAYFTNVDVNHIKSHRHFCNKIWQAFKYTMSQLGEDFQPSPIQLTAVDGATDQWILSRLSAMVDECNSAFSTYSLNTATQALHNFWKSEFCDVYLEYSKPVFDGECYGRKEITRDILYKCVEVSLRALAPFMPFLTEELYQRLPKSEHQAAPSICVANYPTSQECDWHDPGVEKEMKFVQQVIAEALSVRKTFNLSKTKANVFILPEDATFARMLRNHLVAFKWLSRSDNVMILDETSDIPDGCVRTDVGFNCTLYMQLKGLIDLDQELYRLNQLEEKQQQELARLIRELNRRQGQPDHASLAAEEKISATEGMLSRTHHAIETLKLL